MKKVIFQFSTWSEPGQDKTLINVSTLKPGIYLLKVTDGKRVIGIEKVVVEN